MIMYGVGTDDAAPPLNFALCGMWVAQDYLDHWSKEYLGDECHAFQYGQDMQVHVSQPCYMHHNNITGPSSSKAITH